MSAGLNEVTPTDKLELKIFYTLSIFMFHRTHYFQGNAVDEIELENFSLPYSKFDAVN